MLKKVILKRTNVIILKRIDAIWESHMYSQKSIILDEVLWGLWVPIRGIQAPSIVKKISGVTQDSGEYNSY